MSLIAIEHAPGETRAAAFDEEGRPYSFFSWRDPKLDPRARVGDVHEARVTKIDRGTRGFFLELDTGEIAYCHQRSGEKAPDEGARKCVRIEAEGWADKNTRVSLTDDEPVVSSRSEALHYWRTTLPLGGKCDLEDDNSGASEFIDEAFDDAMSEIVTLDGGGQIVIQPTRALTSIDVDSFGRLIRGGTQEINIEAVEAIARHVALRHIGGIVVADLIGAATGNLAADIVKAFRKAQKRYDRRTANILPINRLGLFEFSMPRRSRPLAMMEASNLSDVEKTREDVLEIMRELSRALRDNRASTVEIKLEGRAYSAMQRCPVDWQGELAAKYGARFKLTRDDDLDENGYEVIV